MSTLSRERPLLQSAVAVVSAFGLGVGGLVVGFVLTILAGGLIVITTGSQLSSVVTVVLGLIFIQGIGCAGVALSYYKLRPAIAPRIRSVLGISGDKPAFAIPASVPDLRDSGIVAVGYVTALSGAILGLILIAAVQQFTGTEIDTGTNSAAELGMQNPEVLLLLIPASILLIGPGEELLFRGVVQGRIREMFSPVPGIVIPSVIFVGLHWFAFSGGSPRGNVIALGVLIVPSLVFAAAYEYTDNIVVPSLIHGFYNATLFSLLYVVTFGDQLPQ